MKNNSRKGFTLVELSIVLVIIGLLIGGILAAQSMIQTAQIQSFIRQIGQFDAAVANFKTKYNAIPGDAAAFGCVNGAGTTCNNGVLEDGTVGADSVTYEGEVINFWPQLQQGGFLAPAGGVYTNTITGNFATSGASPNSPAMPFNNGVVALGYGIKAGSRSPTPQNYYAVCNFSTYTAASVATSLGFWCGSYSTIPTVAALAIDTKMDDGLADGNEFYSTHNISGKNVIDYGGACVDPSDINQENYNLTGSAVNCGLLVRMLSSTNLQSAP